MRSEIRCSLWASVALAGVMVLPAAGCGGDDDDDGAEPDAGDVISCGPGTELCGELCVDTDVDPGNCGGCGTTCDAGEVCSAGACSLTCGGGTTECGGLCVDTRVDPANCGACGTACDAGDVCSAGDCGLECVGGSTNCDGVCVDTDLDPTNCGGCGTTCDAGEVCSGGECGLECTGGTVKCGDFCVDVNLDPAHCGDCETSCDAGEVCSGGECGLECTGGTTNCSGICVDTDLDPANCGECGTTCEAGEVCSAGDCGLECTGGTDKCDDVCVDTEVDPANCGGCDIACGADEVCSAGECASVCGGSLTFCSGTCVDLEINDDHCGTCGDSCAATADCIGGECIECDSGITDCDADGWLAADGDCCDKPGLCGSNPHLVNPGAVEVLGNGVDDNCNGFVDLFDLADTLPCDMSLASDTGDALDFGRAMGICRTTEETPASLEDKTWGLISAEILRADGTSLGDPRAHSVRPSFGSVAPSVLEGSQVLVLSTGIAADATQTNPGPNGGAPGGSNVSTAHTPASAVDIGAAGSPGSINDWFAIENLPLKPANGLPNSPSCTTGDSPTANDSVVLKLRLRAPTNAKAFSFNSYFLSAEYPEFVCTTFNDQFIALIDTPAGTPSPIPNPVDKNLMTYNDGGSLFPIGINIAEGTSLFGVCQTEADNPGCWDTDVDDASCSLGASQLEGTGFEASTVDGCLIGGGTFWLTTAGNVIPGEIVEIRIALWDVGDSIFDSVALIDGFRWLSDATTPGTM